MNSFAGMAKYIFTTNNIYLEKFKKIEMKSILRGKTDYITRPHMIFVLI